MPLVRITRVGFMVALFEGVLLMAKGESNTAGSVTLLLVCLWLTPQRNPALRSPCAGWTVTRAALMRIEKRVSVNCLRCYCELAGADCDVCAPLGCVFGLP